MTSGSPTSMTEAVSLTADDLLAEARDRSDALLAEWGERLSREVGGRNGAALEYALRTPGKRVRAALSFAAYRSAGGASAAIAGVAAAVETVHAYSLVHDDLPCMDDDDLRRGRPTTHRRFDVPTATRSGSCWFPSPRACSPRRRTSWRFRPPRWGAWPKSSSRQAASRGWSAGSGSTSRPSGGA